MIFRLERFGVCVDVVERSPADRPAGGYGSRSRDSRDDRDRDTDAASGGPSSWKDSGRAGKQDTVFDVSAGRRRPVVFEEDDDLDVPDFLK